MKLADDCFFHDRDRLRHDEAIALLRERLGCIVETEQVPLLHANGRVLGEDLRAPRDIPAFDNAAVDGYAFAHRDLGDNGGSFSLTGRIAAGDESNTKLPTGTAVRIFTGAGLPPGNGGIVLLS